ncbi:VWA domain-containing protein [Paracrocinitomix mangrovi]|uniref:vWA domain-containing protein n=1 Tax=Paracrocinitomix mangrovi TaxID=2862509 RepID=UPI001C8D310A|nr:VWA domain-containing protein [Paracrocinitomix mangrovi]UKN03690.1 VWA domain-containing protein [Paracrocinitomix mangrovi]
MKDLIEQYIDDNKDDLNIYHPDQENWNKIQQKLSHKRRRNGFLIIGSAAAIMLMIIMISKLNQFDYESKYADSDMDSVITEEHPNRKRIDWDDEPVFNFNKIEPRHLDKDLGWYNLNAQNISYQWTSTVGLTSDNISSNATFNYTVTDNNGCVQNESYNPNHNYPYGYYMETYNEEEGPENVGHYYEYYSDFKENPFETPLGKPLSTFGIDVDAASYSNVRRFLNGNYLPPKNAVKLEEMINYFNYDLPEPDDAHPFSITTEVAECPWQTNHLLMQIALKGESIKMDEDQSNNLVFLIDVSGSMQDQNKLPLLKQSLGLLVDQMGNDDRIAIVAYAGNAGLVLPSTSGKHKEIIKEAINKLQSGGSTAGGEGIQLAYQIAKDEFLKDGNNRVLLCTDGDFNVGVSGDNELVELISEKRSSGIYLSVLGFGTGNLQSSKMEKLADNGNGNYYYIDNLMEAKKVLVDEIGGTLITIAKDVKLQLEFNPEVVKNYRLLGYENRILKDVEFDDDTKDAGEIGSGHTVVALYEIILEEDKKDVQTAKNLRYQSKVTNNSKGIEDEIAAIKFRYKKPKENKSQLISKVINKESINPNPSENFRFASAVAEFGMLLRDSEYKGNASFAAVIQRAKISLGEDKNGYRIEFVELVEKGQQLMNEYLSEK